MKRRQLLLGLYVLAVFGDMAGKALIANEGIKHATARLLSPALAASVESEHRPTGNFDIFRAASRELVVGENLYASRPGELHDRFKYSPTFALIFVPLAWLPWPVGLLLWNALNALLLFFAIDRLLIAPAAGLTLACLLPEVLRSMQNAQSNALVAALMILALLALERERPWPAAAAAVLGAFVKIFPIAALTVAIPYRKTLRVSLASAVVGFALALAPLMVTSPMALLAQYRQWSVTEAADAHQRWFSVMELVHRWFSVDWPNWPLQLAGAILLMAPVAARPDAWTDRGFRIAFLCSLLTYVTLFNHQAERSSYLIAFTGATIWFATSPRTVERTLLYSVAMLSIPLMSTLLPVPSILRSPTGMLYRLAVPTLAIWLVMLRDLVRWVPTSDGANVRVEPMNRSNTDRVGATG